MFCATTALVQLCKYTEQDVINDIIFNELCKNIATAESEAVYLTF